jgi:hypothetical protein
MWRLDFHRLWSVVDSILWKHEEDVGPKGQTWSEVFFGQGAVGVCLIGTCRTQLGTREGTLCSISNLSASWWRLDQELKRVQRYGLIIIDEVGYLPFDADAANLFFQLVSSRYENASVILTSNLPFGRWAEVFGDQTIAAAMIDRLVHHAEVHTLTGDSYRTKNRGIDTLASHKPENKT